MDLCIAQEDPAGPTLAIIGREVLHYPALEGAEEGFSIYQLPDTLEVHRCSVPAHGPVGFIHVELHHGLLVSSGEVGCVHEETVLVISVPWAVSVLLGEIDPTVKCALFYLISMVPSPVDPSFDHL